MKQSLFKLYKEFLNFNKEIYFQTPISLEKPMKFKRSILSKHYSVYHRLTFAEFLKMFRDFIFSKNAFDVFRKNSLDYAQLTSILFFLEEKGIIKFDRDGNLEAEESFKRFFFKPKKRDEISQIIEGKLKVKLDLNIPLLSNLGKDYEWKTDYDQLPVDTKSLVFIVEKVLEYFPVKEEKFLVVGDDDLLSIALSSLGVKCTVIDIDEKLIEILKELKDCFGLPLEIKKSDVRKKKRIGKFFAFHSNPPDTLEGVKSFMKFGINSFDRRYGGFAFTHIGYGDLGNKVLEFQKFLTSNNLKLLEIVNSSTLFPFQDVWLKREKLLRRASSRINFKIYLSASLWIASYIPWKITKLKGAGFLTYL